MPFSAVNFVPAMVAASATRNNSDTFNSPNTLPINQTTVESSSLSKKEWKTKTKIMIGLVVIGAILIIVSFIFIKTGTEIFNVTPYDNFIMLGVGAVCIFAAICLDY